MTLALERTDYNKVQFYIKDISNPKDQKHLAVLYFDIGMSEHKIKRLASKIRKGLNI